ncbi:hypothetical protein ACN42_g9080 [Penicillium freii]|uniref:Uncharacterized protein n=1 Tax=Penicillium freii TaxID=48697 RepID=A0A101MCL4_PENFR|nr:hypothetical protein ACN42_g9080 [Penicillium freii]
MDSQALQGCDKLHWKQISPKMINYWGEMENTANPVRQRDQKLLQPCSALVFDESEPRSPLDKGLGQQ